MPRAVEPQREYGGGGKEGETPSDVATTILAYLGIGMCVVTKMDGGHRLSGRGSRTRLFCFDDERCRAAIRAIMRHRHKESYCMRKGRCRFGYPKVPFKGTTRFVVHEQVRRDGRLGRVRVSVEPSLINLS